MIYTYNAASGRENHLASMAKQMGKWVNQVITGSGYKCPSDAWSPPVNFYEDDEGYCVVVDLAGMQPDMIDLRIEEGFMIVTGNRETPEMPQCRGLTRVHMMEIDHGRFCRQFELPKEVDADATINLAALYRNGYLWISLPKRTRR